MRHIGLLFAVTAALLPVGTLAKERPPTIDMETINAAQRPADGPQRATRKKQKASPAAKFDLGILKAQVLLDRQRFSPGMIDGHDGDSFKKALSAFQQARQLEVTGKLDQATWDALTSADQRPVMRTYEVTKQDLKGPFVKKIPTKLEAMADLKRLGYTSPREQFAERFHVSEGLLARLNPGKAFKKVGDTLLVPDVERPDAGGKVGRIEVDKDALLLRAYDEAGGLLAVYPASIGSDDKPAPSGSFKVKSVARNPTYHYDPKFAFKGVKSDEPFKVAPGPNNPVGAAWIDLSADTYGIHGTPEPSRIGKSFSHGCVRLTNWDVIDLAGMVRKGAEVAFLGGPDLVTGTVAPMPQPRP